MTELGEELIHLTNISSVSMRVKHREPRQRIPHVHHNDLSPSPRLNSPHIDVLLHRDPRDRHHPDQILLLDLIRRWIWREEGELRRQRRGHSSHIDGS